MNTRILAQERKGPSSGFFDIRIGSIVAAVPLTYDLYLMVNGAPVLFRSIGDQLTSERIQLLYRDGGDRFLVRNDQRELYLGSLSQIIQDPQANTELKAKFIKESAFIHVHDLFTAEDIGRAVEQSEDLVGEMIDFVSHDMEAVCSLLRLSRHDYYTYNHCVDVAVYSIALAKKALGNEREILMKSGLGGLLHDIGKRQIEWKVINKNSALNPMEWDEIKMHPTYGMDYLESIPSIPDASRLIVLEHHENFDGTGYPCHLAGDEISPLARVVAIADVFDALTTKRSYHKPMSARDALNMMFGMQPGKFDPSMFRAFKG